MTQSIGVVPAPTLFQSVRLTPKVIFRTISERLRLHLKAGEREETAPKARLIFWEIRAEGAAHILGFLEFDGISFFKRAKKGLLG